MDAMKPGLRSCKSASCRIAIPEGLPVEMWEDMREVVELKAGERGKGHGTRLMRAVCDEADAAGKVLFLMPESGDVMDAERLERFYTRLGFAVVQESPKLMARAFHGLKVAA
jgi:GNAT superfamily N-acetyltransferase